MSVQMGEYSFLRSKKSADTLFSLGADAKSAPQKRTENAASPTKIKNRKQK